MNVAPKEGKNVNREDKAFDEPEKTSEKVVVGPLPDENPDIPPFQVQHRRKPKKIKIKTHPPDYICSYGIIVFCREKSIPNNRTTDYHFLIYQPRDTYAYIKYMMGNWTDATIGKLFSYMSRDERKRISSYAHEELIRDIRLGRETNYFQDCLERSRKKYDYIKNDLPSLIQDNVCMGFEPEWGFPKGKKKAGEGDLECALREFTEETRISETQIHICSVDANKENPMVYSEFYRGTDGRHYCTYYFLAEAEDMIPITKIALPTCIRKEAVSEEVADARWSTYSEACLKLNPRRQLILKKILFQLAQKE